VETPDQAGAVEAAETTTSPSIDFSPVLSRVEELAGSVNNIQEQFSRFNQPEEAEPEDPWASLYGEEPDPEPEPALNIDALRGALGQEMQGLLAPLQQELSELRTSRDLAQLKQEFPELSDPDVAKATGQQARALAESIAGDNAGLLTSNPAFIGLVRKAMVADQNAAGEVPAGGDATTLEAGGAVLAGQQEDQPSIARQVLANRRSLPRGLA
jgi:hypothetical protein